MKTKSKMQEKHCSFACGSNGCVTDAVVVFAGENARAATGIGSADWKTAKLGTQSDGMVTPVYDSAANKLTLNTKAKGKMANTGQSGFEIYYTKVKSKDYNFTIRGRFHTTSVAKQDNQSLFWTGCIRYTWRSRYNSRLH